MHSSSRVQFNNNNVLNKSEINEIVNHVASNPKINNLFNQINGLENILNQNKLKKNELENSKHEINLELKKIEQDKFVLAQKKNDLMIEQQIADKQKLTLMSKYGIILDDPSNQDQLENGMKILKEKIQAEKQKAIAKKQEQLAEKFYGIFHKEKPTSEQLKNLMSNCLQDSPFSEEKIDGKTVVKIDSMIPVINYMRLNPEVTLCKFIAFKSHVNDVATLCDYLKTPECKIRAVGVSNEISEESKALLNSVSISKRQFKVVCQ
ncbi:MAG: hypothetical protein Q8K60_04705 [Parachlamydiaceae bacterium]|nr:hypothetical protein [Parachlamydiaceae bacterium]